VSVTSGQASGIAERPALISFPLLSSYAYLSLIFSEGSCMMFLYSRTLQCPLLHAEHRRRCMKHAKRGGISSTPCT